MKSIKEPLFSNMDFGPHFETLFQIAYYLCFIPYKVIKTKNDQYDVSSSILQKILCGFLQITCCIGNILEIMGLLNTNERKDQALLIRLIGLINAAVYCYIFFCQFCWKREVILEIFGYADSKIERNVKVELCTKFVTVFIFCGSLLSYTFYFVNFEFKNVDLQAMLHRQIEYYWIGVNIPSGDSLESTVLGIFCIVTRLYRWVLVDFLGGLVLLASHAILIKSREFRQILLRSSLLEEEKVFEYYLKLKEAIKSFNECLGHIYLCVFVSLITFCAASVVDILNSKTWHFPLVMLFYFGLMSSPLILAAEAHCAVICFKNWILTRPKRSPSAIMDYLEIENSNLALRGGHFFAITYNFLGTTCSVVLTYAIIMIQSPEAQDSRKRGILG